MFMAEHSNDLSACVEEAIALHQAALSAEEIAVEFAVNSATKNLLFDSKSLIHDMDVLLKHLREFLMAGDRIEVSIHATDSGQVSIVMVISGLPLHLHSGPISRCLLPLTIKELPELDLSHLFPFGILVGEEHQRGRRAQHKLGTVKF